MIMSNNKEKEEDTEASPSRVKMICRNLWAKDHVNQKKLQSPWRKICSRKKCRIRKLR